MIKKHLVALYLETAADNFTRIAKSTTLTIAMNPETETYDYIVDESPTDELTKYKPSIEQDLSTIKGEPDYEFIFKQFFDMKTGSEAQVNAMIVFMAMPGTAENSFKAWKSKVSVIINDYDAVAKKINFTVSFGGTMQKGTATLASGKPVFTEG